MEKFLIAALGNIGAEYQGTRHNAGFDVADAFAAKHGAAFQSGRLADITEIRYRGKLLIVIKPTTYMNLSGRAVKYWMDKERIDAEHILVIMDDIAIPLAKLRLRASGSDGGHNGLKSIQESIGTTAYPRLRFGIGGDYPKGHQVEFVLGKWTDSELPMVSRKIQASAEVIESFVVRGLPMAMNEANKLDFGPDIV
ncbi:MAG: aminoacyl-tRNA hydrolase [Sphingobacteriales bacterium]|jgi:PTH1 family peptidyl-tRNA hydrolase